MGVSHFVFYINFQKVSIESSQGRIIIALYLRLFLIQDNEESIEPEFIGEMYWWPEFKEEIENSEGMMVDTDAALRPVTLIKDSCHILKVAPSGTCS